MATIANITKGSALHKHNGVSYRVLSTPQNLNYYEKDANDPTHVIRVLPNNGGRSFDLFVNNDSLAKHYL